jgi:hypothetical protein
MRKLSCFRKLKASMTWRTRAAVFGDTLAELVINRDISILPI